MTKGKGLIALFFLLMLLLGVIQAQQQQQQTKWRAPFPNERQPMSYRQQPSSRTPYSGWEQWSAWSRCSRSCGGGVQEQVRNCRQRQHRPGVLPPAWQCTGANKKYRWCNARPCPDGSDNSRRSLCQTLNLRNRIPGVENKYTWIPWNRGGPCQLSCKAKGHRLFYQGKLVVTDGTDCSYAAPASTASAEFDLASGRAKTQPQRHICVEGRCVNVGCDNIVGSKSARDECGVCNGDNTTCTVHKGRYRKQYMDLGFNEVVTLPRGARKINITELSASGNYLALRGPDGQFYLNGRATVGLFDRSDTYTINGVPFEYKRPFQTNEGESILSNGPIRSELKVLIFHQEQNPGIHYEFIVPNAPQYGTVDYGETAEENREQSLHTLNQRPYGNELYSQVPKYPSPTGGSVYNVQPLENELTIKTKNGNSYVTNQINAYEPRNNDAETTKGDPNQEKRYVLLRPLDNELSQRVHWEDRGFGQCSQSCAAGIQVSIIKCILNDTQEQVDEVYCRSDKPKPKVKICNRKACPPYYFAGPWSPCTKTCGYGRRTRSVTCRQEFAGNFMTTVSHRKCKDLPRLSTHERCMVQECAHWKVASDWSECTASCGTGKKNRQIACVSGDDKVVPDNECPANRPSRMKSCNAGPCITRWFLSEWDQCSADCDRGFQRRNVFCVNTANRPVGCPRDRQPNATRNCARSSCGISNEWFAGNWGPCSTQCGRGFQERKVACLSIYPNGTMVTAQESDESALPCSLADKPAIQQACNTKECGSKWHYTPWSECSKSCDSGKRVRMVQCLDAEGRFSSGCDDNTRPSNSEFCNTVECDSFENSTCIDSDIQRCRLILKSRFCSYPVYYRERCCRTCSQARKRSRSSPRARSRGS